MDDNLKEGRLSNNKRLGVYDKRKYGSSFSPVPPVFWLKIYLSSCKFQKLYFNNPKFWKRRNLKFKKPGRGVIDKIKPPEGTGPRERW